MKLSDWIKNNWKHVTIEKNIPNGSSVLTVSEINIDLTVGIISTSDMAEFRSLYFILLQSVLSLTRLVTNITKVNYCLHVIT